MDTVRAGCKINLNLLITGRRPDGLHELDSLFYPLEHPYDSLHFDEGEGPGLRVLCDTPGIDLTHNTLTKAYEAFAARTGFAPSVTVRLDKGIPHGMGLGGGSADAAAVLRWLNAKAPQPLNQHVLAEIGVSVGADVPFFLVNRPCRATGIGERLEPVFCVRQGFVLLVCPPVSVSTPWAYAAYDRAQSQENARMFLTGSGTQAIRLASISAEMPPHSVVVNDFEPLVFAAHPIVGRCKALLLQGGAMAAAMSGSGAAVFGLFRDRERTALAAGHIEAETEARTWVQSMGPGAGV